MFQFASRLIQEFLRTESCQTLKTPKTFHDLVHHWKQHKVSYLKLATQARYENVQLLHFQSLNKLLLRDIQPKHIDLWLEELQMSINRRQRPSVRQNFRYQLSILSNIFRHYHEYFDDFIFVNPIKRRHAKRASKIRAVTLKPIVQKNLTVEEFFRFRRALCGNAMGPSLISMATIQYFQALRISEVAALRHEDIDMDWRTPSLSRLRITHSIKWIRRPNTKPVIERGFENSTQEFSVKDQPVFPQTFEALRVLALGKSNGLLFADESGRPLKYRQIHYAYNQAFRKAKLPYRGTHVLRHGGCRRLYNKTADIDVAQQLLGNASAEATRLYAKRSPLALTHTCIQEWGERKDQTFRAAVTNNSSSHCT